MNELMEKIDINSALSVRKMRSALKKKRHTTYTQWHQAANNPRQKILLRMKLENIRNAEVALQNKGISSKESSPVLINLSLIIAPLSLILIWAVEKLYLWAEDAGIETKALFVFLSSFTGMSLVVGTAVLIALGAFVMGIWSFLFTTGALKRKIFSIIFSLVLTLFFAFLMYSVHIEYM